MFRFRKQCDLSTNVQMSLWYLLPLMTGCEYYLWRKLHSLYEDVFSAANHQKLLPLVLVSIETASLWFRVAGTNWTSDPGVGCHRWILLDIGLAGVFTNCTNSGQACQGPRHACVERKHLFLFQWLNEKLWIKLQKTNLKWPKERFF